MQAASREHKDFGQRVVSDEVAVPERQADDERRLTPAQAAARFQIPEYLLRKACADGSVPSSRVPSPQGLLRGPSRASACCQLALARPKRRGFLRPLLARSEPERLVNSNRTSEIWSECQKVQCFSNGRHLGKAQDSWFLRARFSATRSARARKAARNGKGDWRPRLTA